MDILKIEDRLFHDIKKQKYQDIKPIDRIMTFFKDINNDKDLENSCYAKEIYKELRWEEYKYFDVINSFWTTFSCGLAISNYWLASQNKVKKVYYSFANNRVKMMRKKVYAKYYFERNENSEFKIIIRKLQSNYPNIHELAEMCHATINFMSCPKGFNVAKGCCSEVQDFLPLMVDKIEKCIVNEKSLEYINKDKQVKVSVKDLEEWKKWLISNRKKLILEEYYDYDNEKLMLIGRKFFKNQTLEHPIPTSYEEFKECIEEMINRIKNRGNKMKERIQE